MPLKVGDLVRLKSGGPVMTVFELGREVDGAPPLHHLCWFNGATIQRDAFADAELVSAVPSAGAESGYGSLLPTPRLRWYQPTGELQQWAEHQCGGTWISIPTEFNEDPKWLP